jgi:predicted CXXCH cytochrome family protein
MMAILSLRMALALAAGTVLMLLAGAVAYAGPGDVLKTKHNLGSPGGNPACPICHTPHDAKASYLWARSVGDGSGLKPLCYSCHDGSVTAKGRVAFDPLREQHAVNAGSPGQDCDRCHDPHANTYAFTTLSDLGANLCSSCHGKAGSLNHSIDKSSDTAPPADRTFDPNANDYSGTRLYDQAGSKVVTSGSGYLKCSTCHVAHGAVTNKLNTMAMSTSSDASAPLCQNCHK